MIIGLKDGGGLIIAEGEPTTQPNRYLPKRPTTIDFISASTNLARYFDYKFTLSNDNIIHCYSDFNFCYCIAKDKNGNELKRTQIQNGGWSVPLATFFIYVEQEKKIYVNFSAYSCKPMPTNYSDNMRFKTQIVEYPSQNPLDITRDYYTLTSSDDWSVVFLDTIIEDENELDGVSTTGGGGGSFDNDSDDIGVPSLPSFNALNNTMVSLYAMNNADLTILGGDLFSDDFIDNIKKIMQNPIENIIDLSVMPVTPTTGSATNVKIGNITTHASGLPVTSQFYEIDLGTYDVSEHWGSALDYSPYTSCTLIAPYISSINLDIDKIMGHTLGLKYHLDIITGDIVAYVTSDSQIINMATGNIKTSIKLTGANYTSQMLGQASMLTGVVGAVGGVATSNPLLAMGGVSSIASGVVASKKDNYDSVGAFSSTFGVMGLQYAYLVFTRVNQCLPSDYKTINGYPSYITENLSNLTGYTKVESIHLSVLGALDDEVAEIENLLKGGVIL